MGLRHTIAIIVFGLVGLVIAGYGAQTLLKGRAAATWATVDGHIVKSSVESVSKGNQPQPFYHGMIEYAYEVDGKTYRSTRWSFAGTKETANKNQAQSFVNRYREGRSVTVHYDPDDPADAVLSTEGAGGAGWAVVAFGGLLLGLSAIVFAAGRVPERTEPAPQAA